MKHHASATSIALALLTVGLALGALSCRTNPNTPGDPIIAPGSGEVLTEQGPYWVSRKEILAPARFDDAIRTLVFYPSDDAGILAEGGPFPLVIVVQEQGIGRGSFEWIGSILASWGFIVGLPEHPLNRPDLAIDNAALALEGLRALGADGESIFAGGVSTGAAGLIRFNIDASQAAWLDLTDIFQTRAHLGAELQTASVGSIPGAVLVVDGGNDCVTDPFLGGDEYEAERYLVTVDGLAHSQFSNSNSTQATCASDAVCDEAGCAPGISLDEGRSLVGGAVVAFHRVALAGESLGAPLADVLASLEGLSVSAAGAVARGGEGD